ncbi:MAG: zinc ABC transporter substrate-binding protein [Lachnospiraceae bacterium]|nr:zinc ABC transporter substrate-binding protein [Lachnospiraceae bacterium]
MGAKTGYNTRQKEEIIEYLRTVPGQHFTVADVCADFRARGRHIGQTTVYRQLERMVDEGTVSKYMLDGNSAACFEYVGAEADAEPENRFHAKCEKCGRLIHLHCEELAGLRTHLGQAHGFLLNPMRTVFYGICENCRKAGLLLCILLLFLLPGCVKAPPAGSGKVTVIATVFPVYDWAREIIGDTEGVELVLLSENGTDMHSFQPTVGDLVRISGCSVLLYVGGESEAWIGDALRTGTNPDRKAVCLLEALGDAARPEEHREGMQTADAAEPQPHGTGGEPGHPDAESGEAEYDEHIWLSLRNAQILCGVIRDVLSEADPEHGNVYRNNADTYIARLRELDRMYEEEAARAPLKTLLFADRFPFLYLVKDYGLDYYAAFSGCSAEAEAGFGTVIFLAGKLDELGLPCVLKIDGSTDELAETVVRNTGSGDREILTMQSMQAVTLKEAEAGASYVGFMEENLTVLREALGGSR